MRLVSELYSHPISVELSTPFAALSLQLLVRKLQPIWYPGSRPGQRLFARESAVMAHITELPSRAARLRGPGEVLQFPVDDILDERHVLHHGEMGALPDMDLQT